MTISVNVIKELDKEYVQVEARTRRSISNYKVSQASADSFCQEYQNNSNKMHKKSNIIDFVITPFVAITSLLLLGKTKAGSTLKLLACTGFTMLINYAGNIINSNRYIKQKQDIIAKYKAEDMDNTEDVFDKALK